MALKNIGLFLLTVYDLIIFVPLWIQRRVQGTVRKNPVSLKLGFASEDFGYAIDLGLPPPDSRSMFGQDPEIKTETVWVISVTVHLIDSTHPRSRHGLPPERN